VGIESDLIMTDQNHNFLQKWGDFVGPAIFFIFSYLYVWLYIDPKLIYYCFGMILGFQPFFLGWVFFKETLAHPGGAIEYAAGFLSQFYYYSWLGALIVTLTAALIYVLSKKLFKIAGGRGFRLISFIPAILVLMVSNKYGHQLSGFVALACGILFFLIYAKFRVGGEFWRCVLFLFLFVGLYYIGAGSSLLFAILVVIYEIVSQKRIFSGCFCFLVGLIVPYLAGTYIFLLNVPMAYLRLLPFPPDKEMESRVFIQGLYAFLIVAVLAMVMWQRVRAGKVRSGKGRARTKRTGARKPRWFSVRENDKRVLQWAVPVVAAGAIFVFTFDRPLKNLLQVNYFGRNKMWSEILGIADQIPRDYYSVFCHHDVVRALYHTGRLGYDMFSYPQRADAFLLMNKQRYLFSYLRKCELLLEIGNLNYAEKMAYEVLERPEYCPFMYKLLAQINIVKEQYETARIFLRALSKDIIYGKYARDTILLLDKDCRFVQDRQIQRWRSAMYSKNTLVNYNEAFLLAQLENPNGPNRMVFEYMMSSCLLARQLDVFVEYLGYLDELGYKKIPRLYEEAIVLYVSQGKQVDLGGLELNQDTVQAYNNFIGSYMSLRDSRQLALDILEPIYGQSYFFYYFFDTSRVTK